MSEPGATAIFFAVLGLLLAASVLFSRATQRAPVPVAIIFLGLGILAGEEGIGRIAFDDYELTYRLGTAALVLILFDGGLNTPVSAVRQYARPALMLATVGVVGAAAIVSLGARALGFPWPFALLLGAVVSSTDAAAVFAVLRGSALHLKRRVGLTLEIESGLNDPMAVLLTMTLTANLIGDSGVSGWWIPVQIVRELAIGLAAGIAIGRGGRWVLTRTRLSAGGLFPVLTLAIALLAYGVPTLLHGSGFLSVYVAALLLGDGELPYRAGLIRVHDALAWLSQIAMFLLLGLLVVPSRLADAALPGLLLALLLAVVARPLVTALCLFPFRYPPRDVLYVGWVGLRGAVPIVLATMPVLANAPGSQRLFDLVFFIVIINSIIPGATVPWVTRRLDLASGDPPAPQAVIEIESMRPLSGKLMSFYIDDALAVTGVPMSEMPFPEGAAATLIVRGRELIAPRGNTMLVPGDHVYIFARPEDEPFMRLMFGRPEGD
jgi:cell volume regulation protein A